MAVDQALWKRAKESLVVFAVEAVRIGGRIFRRKQECGFGRAFEGAKETGSSVCCGLREGLWSRSLSLLGS